MHMSEVLKDIPRHLDRARRNILTGECYLCQQPVGSHMRTCPAAVAMLMPLVQGAAGQPRKKLVRRLEKTFAQHLEKITRGEHAGWDDVDFLHAMGISCANSSTPRA